MSTCPELDTCSPQYILSTLISYSHLHRGLSCNFHSSTFPTKILYAILLPPCVSPVTSTSFQQYLMQNTHYKSSSYPTCSTLFLLTLPYVQIFLPTSSLSDILNLYSPSKREMTFDTSHITTHRILDSCILIFRLLYIILENTF